MDYWQLATASLRARRERLAKFNPHHVPAGSSDGGQFTTAERGGGKGGGPAPAKGGRETPRPKRARQLSFDDAKVLKTKSMKQALRWIAEGKDVELDTVEEVATLLDELHRVVTDMAAKGEKAPNFNLCKVSVAGSNLFCAEHKGIPRAEMPQLAGTPTKGSRADKLERVRGGEVDGIEDFKKALKKAGLGFERKRVKATSLKATQSELVGAKVAGMMNNKDFDPANAPIFVTRDGYVVDGHHRWATQVGRDANDGHLGDLEMDTITVDAPISAVLRFANNWASDFGIKAKAATAEGGYTGGDKEVDRDGDGYVNDGTEDEKYVGKGCIGCGDAVPFSLRP